MPEETPILTHEQWAKMEEWLRAHPYGDQDENGVDLGSLRRNLQLTPTQRLMRLQSAINSLRKLQGGWLTRRF